MWISSGFEALGSCRIYLYLPNQFWMYWALWCFVEECWGMWEWSQSLTSGQSTCMELLWPMHVFCSVLEVGDGKWPISSLKPAKNDAHLIHWVGSFLEMSSVRSRNHPEKMALDPICGSYIHTYTIIIYICDHIIIYIIYNHIYIIIYIIYNHIYKYIYNYM
jgi:hypothetical protein